MGVYNVSVWSDMSTSRLLFLLTQYNEKKKAWCVGLVQKQASYHHVIIKLLDIVEIINLFYDVGISNQLK